MAGVAGAGGSKPGKPEGGELMRIITDLADVPAELGPTAITVGKFDGVHFGHVGLVSQLRRVAQERELVPVVVTFDRHPRSVVLPGTVPEPIVSLRQRIELLREEGVAVVAVLPFTSDFARLSPLAFIRDVLVGRFGMRCIVVGRDFRFGAGGAGDVELLRAHAGQLGYEVRVAEDEQGPSGRRVSSTWARQLLAAGDVAGAARVLGRLHEVSAEVVHGAKRGRQLGFPTANLAPDAEGFIPADGVYAGWLHDGERTWPAAISVGDNPTFQGVAPKQVEAHVIGERDLDLYGHVVRLAFVDRIRGMERFDGIEQLIERMHEDVRIARELLA